MSFILSSILQKKEPRWNEIIFGDDETDQLLQRLKLPVVVDKNAKDKGEYLVEDGRPFVILKPNMGKQMRLWVLLHEIGHHLLHYPVNHKFCKGTKRKMDREANYFAAFALIPTWLVESKTLGEIAEEYNYPKSLIKLRKEIYDAYNI